MDSGVDVSGGDALPMLAGGSVVTVGTFDGVHVGHRTTLARLQERASASGWPAALVTFRPHPLAVVNPPAEPMLLTPDDEQLDALADSGPLAVIVLPFTAELARYSAERFVSELLIARYHMRELVIGYDHGLGRGRQGDATALAAYGARRGFRVEVVPPAVDAVGAPISSSAIRTLVAHGDLERVERALGRPYCFSGTVVPGSQRGRDLGYPTLNIGLVSTRKLLPPDGVYAVRAQSRRGHFGGMMNLGGRPTFGELDRTLEVHLFDVSGDWYGESVSIQLVKWLRGTARFDGIDALVAQLGRDAEDARVALTQA
ncbi:MAG TPA: bifunctional riboflavin kinase/FAD synthetase [Gemmatimonadaceae bacterium]|jgi:riboflavin kinase/FMN adenylyltransferase|nr:bifunctional riboflavin kinase/FAD synthetase [Gemmatimonadaceae bacterium]